MEFSIKFGPMSLYVLFAISFIDFNSNGPLTAKNVLQYILYHEANTVMNIITKVTVNVLRILTLFYFCSQINFLFSELEFTKCLSE